MLEEALYRYFRYKNFRPGQKETINSLLEGKDSLAVLPTGTGKSLCYQLPAYLREGTVLIVTPLISLMEDQLASLQKNGEKRGVLLNGNLSEQEKMYVLDHFSNYKFVFLSPEMLMQEKILSRLQLYPIALFVVDEAHCISQWGIDFRPEYRNLKQAKKRLHDPVTLALTATATDEVKAEIKDLLLSKNAVEHCYSVDRPNVSLSVIHTREKLTDLKKLLNKAYGSVLIYCATRKKVEEVYDRLKNDYIVGYYHGGLDSSQRRLLQEQFINDQLQILVCTNAFGMGVDKSDIRLVIHYELPDSLENYMQEIGRSGRDQKPSSAVLLYQEKDEKIHHFMQQQAQQERQFFEFYLDQRLLSKLTELQEKWLQQMKASGQDSFLAQLRQNETKKQEKLKQMLDYIYFNGCRREFLLNYFGETLTKIPERCCDFHGIKEVTEDKKEYHSSVNKTHWQEILLKMFKEENSQQFGKT
ncbi:ATP-dependent DNA helicase [Tetragenococcus halophilus]|uniref:RecQ family ATP-dependent DNA helicase n=1 Tax=Tetragenococcus halophilus TaxID=51669 RepID=UPI001F48FD76|nr:ATP-dependent DNA helicase RecQ [Tetragenococcus halophilus]MCF1684979.1 ATP-dependent DNA helicase [Tetragenococcus halophilus]